MCGILGIIATEPFLVKQDFLLKLQRLEYRGYDSVGFALKNGEFQKETGKISPFLEKIPEELKSTLAIAHTRWATTGKVNSVNAHPHFNTNRTIFAVHNGILENYLEMRQELEKLGYYFATETDSEVIPFFFEEQLKQGYNLNQAIINFMQKAEGTFAILLFQKNTPFLYALKKDSPLALGLGKNKLILASDIYAFSQETNQALFFEDFQFAVIKPNSYAFFNRNGEEIKKEPTSVTWIQEETTKEDYPYYMIKEIKEQPFTSARLINSFSILQETNLLKVVDLIKQSKKIVFLACGTSYHASLVGAILLIKLGFNAQSVIASELESFVSFDQDTLAIAISQSGETMDVINVLKKAKDRGAKIISIVNVPFSTIQRLSAVSLEILAGQEICVASTKTFTNQVIILLELARRLGYQKGLSEIPGKIKQTIAENEGKVMQLAKSLFQQKDIFVLGKGLSYPISREIALKLKEIPYIHAEGMMAGELKHGTIALIEEGTPVISLIPNGNSAMLSAAKEVEARGAQVISITNHQESNCQKNLFPWEFKLPASCDAEFAIYAGIIGHLFSYHLALLRGCEIDKPRNLAKSVTVM